MTRTEAIGQLAGYLSTFHWYGERHPEELVELATHALDGVEKLGMLPPLQCDLQGYNGTHRLLPTGYAWEKKDE